MLEVSPCSHSNGGGRPRLAGSPPMPPADLSPSANPGTMQERAIQAFQPNPAIEIQGFNLNAIPCAGGRGREGGKEGNGMLFPHPVGFRSPSRLSGPRDALKLHGSGWTGRPGAAEDATESCAPRWSSLCLGKAGLGQPDTLILLLQGLPRGHKTASTGSQSSLQDT